MRCRWADPNLELYIVYHDNEWGRPEHDDRKLFEMLTLEGFQAGLVLADDPEKAGGVPQGLLTTSSRM